MTDALVLTVAIVAATLAILALIVAILSQWDYAHSWNGLQVETPQPPHVPQGPHTFSPTRIDITNCTSERVPEFLECDACEHCGKDKATHE